MFIDSDHDGFNEVLLCPPVLLMEVKKKKYWLPHPGIDRESCKPGPRA